MCGLRCVKLSTRALPVSSICIDPAQPALKVWGRQEQLSLGKGLSERSKVWSERYPRLQPLSPVVLGPRGERSISQEKQCPRPAAPPIKLPPDPAPPSRRPFNTEHCLHPPSSRKKENWRCLQTIVKERAVVVHVYSRLERYMWRWDKTCVFTCSDDGRQASFFISYILPSST